jgi:hypothetical protein
MRKRSIFLVCIVFVLYLYWWLHRHHHTPVETLLPKTKIDQIGTQTFSNQFVPNRITNNILKEFSAKTVQRLKKRETTMERVLNEWRTPIEFYGKVVDESNNPVSGAQINFSCNDVSVEGTSYYHTISDVEGLFSLKDVNGKLLTAHVSKDGYYASKKDNDSFEYGDRYNHFVPDQNNPIIFHLRRKEKGEPLIQKSFPPGMGQIVQLRHDGTPIEIDLLNGQKASAGSGQLKLEFWRDISEKNARTFDWKLQLSVFSGGLIPTDEEFAFQAPDTNYLPSVLIDMPKTNQPWIGEVRRKYYIQLPDRKYGRIDVYLLPYNGVFTIKSAVNPSGSRNLESSP